MGSLGVGLLLLAFFLHLFGRLARDGYPYLLLNFVGGAVAAWARIVQVLDALPSGRDRDVPPWEGTLTAETLG